MERNQNLNYLSPNNLALMKGDAKNKDYEVEEVEEVSVIANRRIKRRSSRRKSE